VSGAQTPERGAAPVDYLARVSALAPRIAAAADAIERERRLPAELVDAMHEAALFRMLLPRPYAGAELAPTRFVDVIEAVAKLDASAAWCLCQTTVASMISAYLPAEAAMAIFGRDPRAVLAWGAGAGGRAVAVEGGYRVTGDWAFASGGHHATWLGGHCQVFAADGTPRRAADGAPLIRTVLFPAEKAPLTDVWHVIGLKGTGSDAYAVTDLFVPEAHVATRDNPAERRYDAPLYHLRTDTLFACGFAGVALGIARGMLDAFIALALEKTPRGYKHKMRESAVIQTDIAETEARLRAARMYLMGTLGEVWRAVESSKDLTLDHRMAIRLAATHTIREAKHVADAAYYLAGTTSVFASNPFERRFRDMHAVTQQLQGRRSHFETVGRYLVGLDADTAFL
jgi:alkylation response protein AidB-like acyl-CoA dehydrogenase